MHQKKDFNMDVVIGGNRVGSGKKMHTDLNNYGRSNHNLSQVFSSSMGPGMLIPCLVIPATRGDSFSININADCRTIPTKGPLFGSYKMQIDLYQCPIRLYQGILHNNPLAIGLRMNQVKLPKLKVRSKINVDADGNITKDTGKFAPNSLLKYLGMSGLGHPSNLNDNSFTRLIDAVPALAYYDIFKNYYANKQEEDAYYITGQINEDSYIGVDESEIRYYKFDPGEEKTITPIDGVFTKEHPDVTPINIPVTWNMLTVIYEALEDTSFTKNQMLEMLVMIQTAYGRKIVTWKDLIEKSSGVIWNNSDSMIMVTPKTLYDLDDPDSKSAAWIYENAQITGIIVNGWNHFLKKSNISIQSFKLENIDDMRYDILSHHTLGSSFVINDETYEPYYTLVNEEDANRLPLNGIVLKTYQNDIFNNWLNADWIEGPGSIADLTKISTAGNSFTIDAFNLSTKIYNMLNRVVVKGNTYEDWEDAVYTEIARRQIESPIFIGGMSKEIVFDEVIQTSAGDGEDVLGRLGGRGRAKEEQKGGHINVKCDEACFIIGIVSLTPRIYYTQGNEFYMTELDSLDDMHKPGLDGIGFQDLLGERLAYWDTKIDPTSGAITHRSKIGKVPAWIEYMTAVNKGYGDFAEDEGAGYMLLQRNYEYDKDTGGIKDVTTYVDPEKYNYVFAYTKLDAQNFWTQIAFNIKSRRLMSARIIPNV